MGKHYLEEQARRLAEQRKKQRHRRGLARFLTWLTTPIVKLWTKGN